MKRLVGISLTLLLALPLPGVLVGSFTAVAYAGDYENDDNEDDGNRGHDEMLRQQMKDSDRDELYNTGDTSERAQDKEEKIIDTQHEREDLQNNGGGQIKEFFGDKNDPGYDEDDDDD